LKSLQPVMLQLLMNQLQRKMWMQIYWRQTLTHAFHLYPDVALLFHGSFDFDYYHMEVSAKCLMVKGWNLVLLCGHFVFLTVTYH